MARVFVSYSRKNEDFCRQLATELQKRELELWVDWEGIPPTVDWMKEIEKGIEEADTFLAIVSPDWISSNVCTEELDIAVKNGKRLIPVVPCDIDWDSVPATLAHLNFIFFTEAFDFQEQLNKLFTALDTDYDWLKIHRRLQVKALEWERANKESGFLLRGRDLDDAEQQVFVNAYKDPRATDIQREYILKSRQGATRQRRVTIGILMGLITGMLGVIALLVRPYVEEAVAKAQAQELSDMTSVPAGRINFQLVDSIHSIDLAEFSIDRHPVTNEAYGLCVQVNKCTPPVGSADFNDPSKTNDPVVWITIVQAETYCQWVDRRLPTAPEWELAIGTFIKSSLDNDHFSVSANYEWTSSYTTEDWQGAIDVWDGETSNLNIEAWIFLQENASLQTTEDVIIYTNPGGAYAASGGLGFRCARS